MPHRIPVIWQAADINFPHSTPDMACFASLIWWRSPPVTAICSDRLFIRCDNTTALYILRTSYFTQTIPVLIYRPVCLVATFCEPSTLGQSRSQIHCGSSTFLPQPLSFLRGIYVHPPNMDVVGESWLLLLAVSYTTFLETTRLEVGSTTLINYLVCLEISAVRRAYRWTALTPAPKVARMDSTSGYHNRNVWNYTFQVWDGKPESDKLVNLAASVFFCPDSVGQLGSA
jgi:hypothetical protein